MTNEEHIKPEAEETDIKANTETQESIDESNETNAEPNETEKLNAQLQEANDKFLRLYAEFDNYKRRTIKERAELLQTASKDVILSFLPVIDDFERAIKAADNTQDIQALKDGITLIYHKFNQILNAKGLAPIKSIGENFNVDMHEGITNIPAPTEEQKGKVIDEVEKGYTLNGQVIRFAKVIIGE